MRLPYSSQNFSVQGLNLERFLNLLLQNDIRLLHAERTDSRTLHCTCRSADFQNILAIAAQKGWCIQHTGAGGFSAVWTRVRKRPGIPIGILLMFVFLCTATRFIWKVDIRGAAAYQAELSAFLQQNGYTAGIRRNSVDAKVLESALTQRYPEIAWFQAYVSGMTLVVEVTHGALQPQEEHHEAGSLYAQQNGIIHSIRVYAGTATVKAGDVVQKGDLLIRGEERSYDGTVRPVHANGVVLARCWESFSVRLPMYEFLSSETGAETAVTSLCTPWFSIPLWGEEPAYLTSNRYITQIPIGGVFFPLYYQTTLFREVSLVKSLRDERQVRAEAAQAALKKLKMALFDHDIIDKWVDYCMIEDDILALSVSAEKLVDIGVFSSP